MVDKKDKKNQNKINNLFNEDIKSSFKFINNNINQNNVENESSAFKNININSIILNFNLSWLFNSKINIKKNHSILSRFSVPIIVIKSDNSNTYTLLSGYKKFYKFKNNINDGDKFIDVIEVNAFIKESLNKNLQRLLTDVSYHFKADNLNFIYNSFLINFLKTKLFLNNDDISTILNISLEEVENSLIWYKFPLLYKKSVENKKVIENLNGLKLLFPLYKEPFFDKILQKIMINKEINFKSIKKIITNVKKDYKLDCKKINEEKILIEVNEIKNIEKKIKELNTEIEITHNKNKNIKINFKSYNDFINFLRKIKFI